MDRESNIISPFEGKVISLTSSAGQSISAGADLVQIARGESEGLRHIAFIPVTKGKKVKVGMGALVTPSNVSRSAFGGIKGKITYVSPFPVSESRIMSVVGNEAIVQKFTNGPVLELNVKLSTNAFVLERPKIEATALTINLHPPELIRCSEFSFDFS